MASEHISRDLGSDKAARYVNRKKREEELLAGKLQQDDVAAQPDALDQDTIDEALSAMEDTPAPVQRATAPQPATVPPGCTSITIQDMHLPVVMSCQFTGRGGRSKVFSVKIHAISVDAGDNGVSVVLNSDLEIEPPVMEPMTLKCGSKLHHVIYTGGRHKFGPFVNMYFTRTAIDEE